ncbi:MAG: hypothetical protein MR210_06325 [Erysipelotrichaceae bacterium]|nr:hypothetical protein [Erysipelotrichaceae bacterium]MDY5251866.1 hypothetical protein [Erysipelotrichaceae bacterium]
MHKFAQFIKITILVLIFLVLIVIPVNANSAQVYWEGSDASGIIIIDEASPIIVEHEDLTFKLSSLLNPYDQSREDLLAYDGQVIARYTMYNPATYQVKAHLLFPFGTRAEYGRLGYDSPDHYINNNYGVKVNDQPIPTTIRHSYILNSSQFVLDKDLAMLHDDYMADSFYHPELKVTAYKYIAKNVDLTKYNAATAAFSISNLLPQTKILMENLNGGALSDDTVRLDCWVDEEPFMVYIIGEPLPTMPTWYFYENGACEKEIPGTMELLAVEEMTLKDLCLSHYDKQYQVLEHDWYNAIIQSMKHHPYGNVAIEATSFTFDIYEHLMPWYEYEITLASKERITNTVNAPIYPSIDLSYDPGVYEYTYLLSPAKTWQQFGDITIKIETPFQLVAANLKAFKQVEDGYMLELASLPDSELIFSLSLADKAQAIYAANNFLPYIILAISLISILILLLILMRRKRSNNNSNH